jgi:hypothetical protein
MAQKLDIISYKLDMMKGEGVKNDPKNKISLMDVSLGKN